MPVDPEVQTEIEGEEVGPEAAAEKVTAAASDGAIETRAGAQAEGDRRIRTAMKIPSDERPVRPEPARRKESRRQ